MSYSSTTSPKIISRRVRRLRRKMGLTLREFAAHFGVQLKEVWRWEHQERVPQLRHQRTLYAMEQNLKMRDEEEAIRSHLLVERLKVLEEEEWHERRHSVTQLSKT